MHNSMHTPETKAISENTCDTRRHTRTNQGVLGSSEPVRHAPGGGSFADLMLKLPW